MALAGSRTRQMQRIPWKFDGISGTKCRSLAQSITHKAHSPRNLRRLLPGTRTGYHSGDGRHWVRPHWLAASGQLGRSRLMTSRDRVLATTISLTKKDPTSFQNISYMKLLLLKLIKMYFTKIGILSLV